MVDGLTFLDQRGIIFHGISHKPTLCNYPKLICIRLAW
jgi:hypothetical protein